MYHTEIRLLKSGQGYIVMQILLDVNGFYLYDNRESLSQQPSGEESE
jgi:hypothetical protein